MPARLTDSDLLATHAKWVECGRDIHKAATAINMSAITVRNRLRIAVCRGLVEPVDVSTETDEFTRSRAGTAGAVARAAKLSHEQRSSIAREAACRRWSAAGRPRSTDEVLLTTHAEYLRQGRSGHKTAAVLGVSPALVYQRLRTCAARSLVPQDQLPDRRRSHRATGTLRATNGHPHAAGVAAPPSNQPRQSGPPQFTDQLWDAFDAATSVHTRTNARNALAMHYWPDVTKSVHKFCCARRLADPCDVESAASEALLLSIPRFDRSRGFQFMSFFGPRLNGAMLDACRQADQISRLGRARLKQRLDAEQEVGGCPDAVKKQLVWDDATYRHSLVPTIGSIHQPIYEHDKNAPFHQQYVSDTIGALPPPRDQDDSLREILRGCSLTEMVICYLYYKSEQTMRTIGQMVHLSESRVSQVHSGIIERVRRRMVAAGEGM